MYLPDDTDPDIIYVFATRGGAPMNPDWYYNLTVAGDGSVERRTETYKVTVREAMGDERDRIYAEQARRYPGFAEYERQTDGSAPSLCSNLGGRSPHAETDQLFESAGDSTIDLGDLTTGGKMQQVHGPLAGVDLTSELGGYLVAASSRFR